MEEETLLSSLLTQGSVASFVDLFYLAHRGLGAGEAPEELSVLRSIAASLVAGEAAQRAGDNGKLLESLHATGAHYADAGKPGCAIMFFARALALARAAGAEARQLDCLRDLGRSEFARGDFIAACERHEERRALALRGGHAAALEEAARDLVGVRMLLARGAEARGEVGESLRLFESALEAARYAGDAVMEADLFYCAGRAYAIAGHAADAVARLGEFVRVGGGARRTHAREESRKLTPLPPPNSCASWRPRPPSRPASRRRARPSPRRTSWRATTPPQRRAWSASSRAPPAATRPRAPPRQRPPKTWASCS
jgi:hypothetical protein